jgi:ATP-dependent Clp protease ATP-binding subunit ClpC
MNKKFSPVVKQIIHQSGQEARRLGHDYIGTEHLLLGIIAERDSLPVRVLDALLVDVNELKKRLERNIPKQSVYPPAENLFVGEFQVTTQVQRVLKVTFLEAKLLKSEEIFPEHLMLSLLKHSDTLATKLLNEYDVDYETFKKELEYVRSEQDLSHPNLYNQTPGESGDYEEEDERGFRAAQKSQAKSRTPRRPRVAPT